MLKIMIGLILASFVVGAYLYIQDTDTGLLQAVKSTSSDTLNISQSRQDFQKSKAADIDTLSKDKLAVASEYALGEGKQVSVMHDDEYSFLNELDYLTSHHFKSAADFTSAFLNDDGIVKRAAIVDTFNVNDFQQLIEQVELIEKSENAAMREQVLSETMHSLDNVQIISENYSCAGKICVVSFHFEGNDENVEPLSTFSSNYSFTNISADDTGIKQLKAVYIEADDPSTLRLTQ
ncbi:hypothetical protein [Shewanella maritima]|uniref:hypothetical protein n=1 Tax=Shewanella maritima TaxID=2520507 RepID=UPI003736C164